jgi:hypothetical protein
MARPQVADGGDALHLWRAAANILENQPWTAGKGGHPGWGLGVVQQIPHSKKYACYERLLEASDLDGLLG